MRRFGLLVSVLAAGCTTEFDLGETASGGEGSGSGGSDTGGTDDPSQSGGSPTGTQASTSSVTGGSDGTTGDDGTTGPGTDTEEPPQCEPAEQVARWWDSTSFNEPIPGIAANSEFVFSGPCSYTGSVVYIQEEGQPVGTMLDCALTGYRDGSPDAVQVSTQAKLVYVDMVYEPAQVAVEELELRVAARNWGQAWERWMVLSTADGRILIDAVAAPYLDPNDSGIGGLVQQYVDEPWRGPYELAAATTACETIETQCGEQRSVEVFESGDVPAFTLEVGQAGDLLEDTYRVYVQQAIEYDTMACDDTPEANYRVVAVETSE